MESLSPECTPLKHRYDSCFNSWFEGYLQPALDADPSRHVDTPLPRPQQPPPADIAGPSKPPAHRQIITNWSSAFPRRSPLAPSSAEPVAHAEAIYSSPVDDHVSAAPTEPYDTKGKTRNQIKAEEYERRCGSAWRSYQTCLKKAVRQNQSLATLLDQARDEHPLKSQGGLKGTVWDADYVPEA